MQTSVFTIARYSLLEAIRGKIIWIISTLLILSVLLSLFISQTALTETQESQVALMAGFLRLSSMLVMIFFVVSSVARDFQDKSIELIFAVSIPRYQVFLGKFFGFSLLAFLVSILYTGVLFFYADASAVLIWSLSLWCELSLVALLSLSLAVLNIFPFPALDGGRLVFVFAELIRRKPVNRRFELTVNAIGFFFLLSVIFIITFYDIIRLF